MTTFINSTNPFLRILTPSGDYISFIAGKLEMDEDEPHYDVVLGEAVRNPLIAIIVNETTCQFCGEVFEGKKAQESLDAHKKDNHFDLWVAQAEIEAATVIHRLVKERAGYACDVCAPVQTFGSEDDLGAHVRLLHTAAPVLDEDGNDEGGGDERRPGEVVSASAARASTRKH